MTTYELHDFTAEHRTPDLFAPVGRLLGHLARHHRRRRTLRSIAHLDAAQLEDIGLDPSDVADARNGDGAVLWAKIARLR